MLIVPVSWKGVDSRFGWSLFVAMLLLEVLIAALMIVWLHSSREAAGGVATWRIVILAVVHEMLWTIALVHVAGHSRHYYESVAPWLFLMLVYQGLGLALYLASCPEPHNDC